MKKILEFLICVSVLALTVAMFLHPEERKVVQVRNESFSLSYNPAEDAFTIEPKSNRQVILSSGKHDDVGGTAETSEVDDPIFGLCRRIDVRYPDGSRRWMALYQNLPFVQCGSTLRNSGNEPQECSHLRTVSMKVTMGVPSSSLRALGSVEPIAPDVSSGSDPFLVLLDPRSKNGIVGGWLSHDGGSEAVIAVLQHDAIRVNSRIDYVRRRIQPGEEVATQTFALGYFNDVGLGLKAYSAAAKKFAVNR